MVTRNRDLSKRMNYFDRQFLRAQDFMDEQDHYTDRRWRHNRLLHVSGVAENLIVSGKKDDSQVSISEGTAIDDLGREIVLLAPQVAKMPGDPTTRVEIYISYAGVESDDSADPGSSGKTRLSEAPVINVRRIEPGKADPVPVSGVLLASVAIAGGKITTDPNNGVRQQAATRVGDDLIVNSLTLKRDNVPTNQRPRLSCSGPNQTALQGSDLIVPNGKLGIGTTNPTESLETNLRVKSGALTIGPWPANANYVFVGSNALDQSRAGNYALLVGVAAEPGVTFLNSPEAIRFRIGNFEKMTLTKDGNVGIGTTTPTESLETSGRVKAGALTVGPWPANLNYVYFGSNALDQTKAGNYALLMGVGSEPGVTYLNSPERIGFRIGNEDKMILTKEGFFGVGCTPATHLNRPLTIQNPGDATISLLDTSSGTHWEIQTSALKVDTFGVLKYNPQGQFAGISLLLDNAGNLTVTGAIHPGSSREYKEDIAYLSAQEAAAMFKELDPVKFSYKADQDRVPHIGFIAEDVPDALATPDKKGLGLTDIVAVLTKVLQQQHKALSVLEKKVKAMEESNQHLKHD